MQPGSVSSRIHKITLYNGCTVAYTDTGTGTETLLFIHGLGAYSATWQKNIEHLSRHYRCIAIDLPGNGHSDTGDYSYTMDFFARCLIDFIGRVNLRQVTLVGHSMGGQIALTAALMLPACCDRLVLCAPAGIETFSAHERMMYKASLGYMSWITSSDQAIRHLVGTSFYHMPKDARWLQDALVAIAERQPAKHYKMMTERCISAMLAEPVAHNLHKLRHPALIIFGEQDALIPNTFFHPVTTRSIAEEGARKIPNASLHILPRCGHFVQWECAGRVNSIIQNWLKGA